MLAGAAALGGLMVGPRAPDDVRSSEVRSSTDTWVTAVLLAAPHEPPERDQWYLDTTSGTLAVPAGQPAPHG
jgi:hypothetical protein